MSDEVAGRSASAPTPLNLDEVSVQRELDRTPVVLGGETYYMAGIADLSMSQQEDYRRVMARVVGIVQKQGTALVTPAEEQEMVRLERRLCQVALPDAPATVIQSMTPAQRNALTKAFFIEVGLMTADGQLTALSLASTERRTTGKRQSSSLPKLRDSTTSSPPISSSATAAD